MMWPQGRVGSIPTPSTMRALVIGVGGLRGAYDAGVAATLCRNLGSQYFDAIYMSSVGVFAGTFYAANQPDVMENTWRNYVHGRQLINFLNPFRQRNILDTEYLIDIFRGSTSYLDVDRALASQVALSYSAEHYPTGNLVYLQPDRERIFDMMRAATALPFLHAPVKMGSETYIDAGFVDPLPFQKALADGHTDITVIYNKSPGFYVGRGYQLFGTLFSLLLTPTIGAQARALNSKYKTIERSLADTKHIRIIRPSIPITMSITNTNQKNLHQLFDLGVHDAKEYLRATLSYPH